ncbi:MAG TPA: HD domain-containing protein [Verrucomicrobiae bacterium]|nr:HD domain-containing protein [Verrucomicrobiae bacterium]
MTETTSTGSRPVAVIDIGASAIRLRIAEISADGAVRNLESLHQAVRLGKDAFSTGHIQAATVEECIKVLAGFRRVMVEYGITRDDQIRAVATSALREADNRAAVLDRLYMSTQINVEVIEGAEENRLTYIAVQDVLEHEPRLKVKEAVIIDVGGGSTELLLLQEGRITYAQSYRLGALRMRETLETYRAPADRVRSILDQHIRHAVDQIRRTTPVGQVRHLIGVSGDAQFAAALLAPDWPQVRVSRLDGAAFTALAEKLVPLPVDDLVRAYRLPYQGAETIGPGLLAYAHLARAFQVNELIVPKCSLRDGLLKEMAAPGAWTQQYTEQVVHAVMSLGRKYQVDEKHAQHVAELSVRLFRELQPEHQLDRRFELLLRIAALLHEVGNFISDRSHHKHSMYIILNSELFGLAKRDLTLIALIARYHRRAMPRPYHEEFQLLDRDSRIAVLKLASILRVADALERNHMQLVRELKFSREKGQFLITVKGVGDLTLERLALREKGDLFEEVYGLKPALRAARPTREVTGDG